MTVTRITIDVWQENEGWFAECSEIKNALAFDERADMAVYTVAAVAAQLVKERLRKGDA
jgi:hypothetical protein